MKRIPLLLTLLFLSPISFFPSSPATASKLSRTEVDKYVQQLRDKDPNTRYSAISAIQKSPSEAVAAIPTIISLLTDPDNKIREEAAKSLGVICVATKSSTLEIITGLKHNALKDKDSNVRFRSAEALRDIEAAAPGTLQKIDPYLISDLISALASPDSEIRDGASYALGQLQNSLGVLTPKLLNALQSSNSNIRSSAARAFQSTNPETQIVSNKLIAPALLRALKDESVAVRKDSASSLGSFCLEAKLVIPSLIRTIQLDSNSHVRYAAISSLGRIYIDMQDISPEKIRKAQAEIFRERDTKKLILCQDAIKEVQGLAEYKKKAESLIINVLKDILLKDRDNRIKSVAADYLCKIAKDDDTLPFLVGILKTKSGSRRGFASSLSRCSSKPKVLVSVIPDLVTLIGDPEIHFGISDSLAGITETLQDEIKELSNKDLDKIIAELEKALKIWEKEKDEFERRHVARIRRSLLVFQRERAARISNKIATTLQKYPWLPAIPAIPVVYGIILWLRPRWLLFIPATLVVPKLGKIPLKIILFLKYRPRVMDAWVTHYLGSDIHTETDQPRAKLRFREVETVSLHQTYIPLPLNLSANQQANRHESLPLAELQGIFRENTVQLLLYGEGGVGKTSLACHLAQLAMANKPDSRLCKHHSMLPVLIEPELLEQELVLVSSSPNKTTVREVGAVHKAGDGIIPLDETVRESWNRPTNQALIEAIRKQVQFLINEQEPISDELLKHLLQAGRILVIVDRVSEMSQAAHQTIDPTSKTYPINALVLTSRQREKIGNIQPDVIEPLPLTGSELMRFMEEYLKATRNIELQQQPQLYQACANLQKIVEARGDKSIVTVLLAKLAVDQLIANKPLPTSIPDLMLKSLDVLNDQVQRHEFRPDYRTVYRDAQAIAWTCLQSTYRPNTAPRTAITEMLTKLDPKADVPQRLNYLATELRVVDIVGANQDQIRIALDPMSEYLAGLHLINLYGTNDSAWRKFLKQASEFDKLGIQGFMLAVQDCCRVASLENKVSATIVDEFKSFTR